MISSFRADGMRERWNCLLLIPFAMLSKANLEPVTTVKRSAAVAERYESSVRVLFSDRVRRGVRKKECDLRIRKQSKLCKF